MLTLDNIVPTELILDILHKFNVLIYPEFFIIAELNPSTLDISI